MTQYEELVRALTGFAGTLAVADVGEITRSLVRHLMHLLPVEGASVLVADPDGALSVSASSDPEIHELEQLQIDTDAGSGVTAYRTGRVSVIEDLARQTPSAPPFESRAFELGFRSVHAVPLQIREERFGAVNLFRRDGGRLATDPVHAAQAFADLTSLVLRQQRMIRRIERVNVELREALGSRIQIEQAKGVLSERGRLDPDQAFQLMRAHARRTNQRLVDLARAVNGGADTTALLSPG